MSILWKTSLLADGPMGSGQTPSDEQVERRKVFIASFGAMQSPVMARASHSTLVSMVDDAQAGLLVDSDALLTRSTRLPLVVVHSDCLPVFLWDAHETLCGVVHAGWRGVVDGIVPAAIGQAIKLGVSVDDLRLAIGPHIRSCCFVIKEDVALRLRSITSQAVMEHDGVMHGDLLTAVKEQLKGMGIDGARMLDEAACTCHNPEYASYRRDGELARNMMSFIVRT